jgi:uncharacterized membrane protein
MFDSLNTVIHDVGDSIMKHRSIDLLIVICLTIVAIALIFKVKPENVPIRILTLPLVLVLPGYALISALFPRSLPGVPESFILSLGLSIVIIILGGLILNWTSFGLHSSSWVVLLASITIGASTVGLIRRRRQGISASHWLGNDNIGFTFRQGLQLSLAIIVLVGAMAIAVSGSLQRPRTEFTQLWILPTNAPKSKHIVRLGINNMELTTMKYNLDVSVGNKIVKKWLSIDLEQGEKWETVLVLPQSSLVGTEEVEATLYRTDIPTKIYRHVGLWIST